MSEAEVPRLPAQAVFPRARQAGPPRGRHAPVEHQIAQVVATEVNHYVSLSDWLDRLVDRVERIERRLDIVPA